MQEMLNHPPKFEALLRSFSAGDMPWRLAASELIDNALDKNASKITFEFRKQTMIVRDNGIGTPHPEDIVTPGEHKDSPHGIGEFGMGGKEALLWAAGVYADISISTVHQGFRRDFQFSWQDYVRLGWNSLKPIVQPAAAEEIGTIITIEPLQQEKPNFQQLAKDLGYYYYRALANGKVIELKSERGSITVTAWQPPEFQEGMARITNRIIQVHGKQVGITAGIVKEGAKNEHRGLTYIYGNRVIIPHSQQGCGSTNTKRLYGVIDLMDPGWRAVLTRNKNNLAIKDNTLYAKIEDELQEVLQAADDAADVWANSALNSKLELFLGEIHAGPENAKKARRKPPQNQTGTVKPVGTDRTHKQAKDEQDGPRFPRKRNANAIRIVYTELDENTLGEAQFPVVYLNQNNPYVQECRKTDNEMGLRSTIVYVVVMHDYHMGFDHTKKQRKLNFGDRWFLPKWDTTNPLIVAGQILARYDEHAMDSKEILKLVKPKETTKAAPASA